MLHFNSKSQCEFMRKGTKHISLLGTPEESWSNATNRIGLLSTQVSVLEESRRCHQQDGLLSTQVSVTKYCCLPPNGTEFPLGNFRSEAENYKVGGSGCWQESGTENSDWGDLVEMW